MHVMILRPRSEVLDVKLSAFLDGPLTRVWVSSQIDSSPPWTQSLLEVYGSSPDYDPTCQPRMLTIEEINALSSVQIYDGEFVFRGADGEWIVEYMDASEVEVRSDSIDLLDRVRRRMIEAGFMVDEQPEESSDV